MGSLQNAKIIGGIGALLMLIGGFVTASVGVLSLIGFIMVFIAVKWIADETKEKAIFDNYLYAFIAGIIMFVVAIAIAILIFASVGGLEYFTNLSNMTDPMAIWETLQPVIISGIAGLLVVWIILIIASLFIRKSFNLIAEKTGVKWFATTGLLFFIGAITAIILIGFLILIIASILEIVAFFSLPDTVAAKPKEE